jgi:hypothetical protein
MVSVVKMATMFEECTTEEQKKKRGGGGKGQNANNIKK